MFLDVDMAHSEIACHIPNDENNTASKRITALVTFLLDNDPLLQNHWLQKQSILHCDAMQLPVVSFISAMLCGTELIQVHALFHAPNASVIFNVGCDCNCYT